MATLAQKRKEAKEAGIPATAIKSANTVEQLETVIRAFGASTDDGNGDAPKPRKKSAVKQAVKKSVTKPAKKSTRKVTKSASSKTEPAKSRKSGAQAKRPSTAKKNDADSGRNMLNGVDYSETDGWNARDGSAPDRIIKALKKSKGNRAKVYDLLAGDVWDFVGKKFRNGEKRSKSDALEMLKYRISRTAWDFARATGQHDPSENRVEYGTGGTGTGAWKPAKKKTATKTVSKKQQAAATRKTTKTKSATKKKASWGTKKSGRKTTAPARKTSTKTKTAARKTKTGRKSASKR